MNTLSPGQIKAARALLGITREALADATRLSPATIRNLEAGNISYRSLQVVRQALEAAGIEFTDDDGLRRKADDLRILRGTQSVEAFYEDLLQTLRAFPQTGLCAVVRSQDMLFQSCGATVACGAEKMGKLVKAGGVRCLLTEDPNLTPSETETTYKTISRTMAGPMPYFIYGNKCALVLPSGGMAFRYVVFQESDVAVPYRQHFEALWMAAAPLALSGMKASISNAGYAAE